MELIDISLSATGEFEIAAEEVRVRNCDFVILRLIYDSDMTCFLTHR